MKIQQYLITENLLKGQLKSQELIITLDKDVVDECEKARKSFNNRFVYPISTQTFCNGLLSVMKFPMIDAKYIIHIADDDDDVTRLKMLPNVWENCTKHYQVCVNSYLHDYLQEYGKEDPQHYQRFKDVIRDKEMAWVEANFKFDTVINTLLIALINNFTEEDEEDLADWITDYFTKSTSIDANR